MFVFLDTEYPVLSNKHLFPTSSTPSPFLTINLLIHLLLTSNLHYFETHKLINCHYYKFITLNTGIIIREYSVLHNQLFKACLYYYMYISVMKVIFEQIEIILRCSNVFVV